MQFVRVNAHGSIYRRCLARLRRHRHQNIRRLQLSDPVIALNCKPREPSAAQSLPGDGSCVESVQINAVDHKVPAAATKMANMLLLPVELTRRVRKLLAVDLVHLLVGRRHAAVSWNLNGKARRLAASLACAKLSRSSAAK